MGVEPVFSGGLFPSFTSRPHFLTCGACTPPLTSILSIVRPDLTLSYLGESVRWCRRGPGVSRRQPTCEEVSCLWGQQEARQEGDAQYATLVGDGLRLRVRLCWLGVFACLCAFGVRAHVCDCVCRQRNSFSRDRNDRKIRSKDAQQTRTSGRASARQHQPSARSLDRASCGGPHV